MSILIALVASVLAIAYAAVLYRRVLAAPDLDPARERDRRGDPDRRRGVPLAASTGRWRWSACRSCLLLLVLLGRWYALGFLVGALASAAAGFIGMNVSVRANVRVAQAAHDGLRPGLRRSRSRAAR